MDPIQHIAIFHNTKPGQHPQYDSRRFVMFQDTLRVVRGGSVQFPILKQATAPITDQKGRNKLQFTEYSKMPPELFLHVWELFIIRPG